jgi:hypothetical protein
MKKIRIILNHIQKKRGSLTVTHPTLGGLGVARFDWTSNAEAHADMYIDTPKWHAYYISMNVHNCFALTEPVNRQVSKRQAQSEVNAFVIYVILPHSTPSGLLQGLIVCKVKKINIESKKKDKKN